MKNTKTKRTSRAHSGSLKRAVRMRQAIEWALGTHGEFKPRPTGFGPYWWRMELAERAGLKWDGKKWVGHANNRGQT